MTLGERKEKGRRGKRLREQSPTQGPEQLPCKQGEQHQICLSGHWQESCRFIATIFLFPLCALPLCPTGSQESLSLSPSLSVPTFQQLLWTLQDGDLLTWKLSRISSSNTYNQSNRAVPRRKGKMQPGKPGISC